MEPRAPIHVVSNYRHAIVGVLFLDTYRMVYDASYIRAIKNIILCQNEFLIKFAVHVHPGTDIFPTIKRKMPWLEIVLPSFGKILTCQSVSQPCSFEHD